MQRSAEEGDDERFYEQQREGAEDRQFRSQQSVPASRFQSGLKARAGEAVSGVPRAAERAD